MDNILVMVDKIDEWFVKADYKQAYETLVILCKPYSEFEGSAKSILSRYNDCCKSIEMGVIPLSEQYIRKQEIATSYQMCMNRFKECHINACPICCIYEEESSSLTEQRNRIRKTKLKIEDEYTECDDPDKVSLLEKILEEIRKILKQFDNLLKYFSEVSRYGRI